MRPLIFKVALCMVLFVSVKCTDPLSRIKLNQRKVVTRCFISPQDTLLTAFVNWDTAYDPTKDINLSSQFPGLIIEDTVNQIKDAHVTISDAYHHAVLDYQPISYDPMAGYDIVRGGCYSIRARQFPIIPGETYTLTVKVGQDIVATASCNIPVKAPSFAFQYYNTGSNSPDPYNLDWDTCHYEIKWADFPGKGDFYRVAFCHYDTVGVYRYYRPLLDVTLDQTLFNDLISDGGNYDFRNSFGYQHGGAPDSLYAFVLHVDRHYYNYHRSINDQLKIQSNPFYEPILLYTNFEGGLGVFAGYNMAKISRRFIN